LLESQEFCSPSECASTDSTSDCAFAVIYIQRAASCDTWLAHSTRYNSRMGSHASGCSTCVDITRDVMRLMREGKDLKTIRSYIDMTYSQYGPATKNRAGQMMRTRLLSLLSFAGLAVQLGTPVISEDSHLDERHTRNWPNMPRHRDVCLPLRVHGA
jgi:hypothetical protein